MWQLQLYCHVQPRAAFELAHTPSHSLALARLPVGSHCLELVHFLAIDARTKYGEDNAVVLN